MLTPRGWTAQVDTPEGGACWARILNQNYAVGRMTASIMWNLVTSFYTSLPYFGASLMNAAEPWSGHYSVKSPIWATAHHTQFTNPGWTFLAHGQGVGTLEGGGTYVTYFNGSSTAAGAVAGDWTLVVEKVRASTGPCLRDSFTNDSMTTETITFTLGAGLRSDAPLQVWRSDWSKGALVTGADLFQRGPSLHATEKRRGVREFTLTLHADEVVTVTSIQRAGMHPRVTDTTPPSRPFPKYHLRVVVSCRHTTTTTSLLVVVECRHTSSSSMSTGILN